MNKYKQSLKQLNNELLKNAFALASYRQGKKSLGTMQATYKNTIAKRKKQFKILKGL